MKYSGPDVELNKSCAHPQNPWRSFREIGKDYNRIASSPNHRGRLGPIENYQICLHGERRFIGILEHLNQLNSWAPAQHSLSKILQAPRKCPQLENEKLLVLMAIKSKPTANLRRDAIRRQGP